jgi:hypothetical protein
MNESKVTSRNDKEPVPLADRVANLERIVGELQKRINIEDRSVKPPSKKNNNPDYLPVGGPVRGLDEMPPKVT